MELNYLLFQQPKTQISLEAFLNGKLAYIPKLQRVSEDSQIPLSPKSSRVSVMMAKYPCQPVKASRNINYIPEKESPISSPSRNTINEIEDTIKNNFSKKSGFSSSSTQFSLNDDASQITQASSISTPKKQSREDLSEIEEQEQFSSSFSDSPAGVSQITSNTCPASAPERNIFKNALKFISRNGTISQQTSPTKIFETLKNNKNHHNTQILQSNANNSNSSQYNKRSNSSGREATLPESQQLDPAFRGFDISTDSPTGFIPVLYLESRSESDNLLIYFHGNGDDVFSSYPLLDHLRSTLEINVMAVEYPGYGNYKFIKNCSADLILEDAEFAYSFVTKQLGFKDKNIIVAGRSLGTGPASYIASHHKIGCLVMISAFTSIRGVVSGIAGFFQYMIKERFNNLENIKKLQSPLFLLHGASDSLISFKQSRTLAQHCKSPCELHSPADMTHSAFDYQKDLSTPLIGFLQKHNFPLFQQNNHRRPLPEGLTFHPSHFSIN